jgi:hypothetical protein
MKVLFDFSRRGIPQYHPAFEAIRNSILETGHSLTNDLLQETTKIGKTLPQEVFNKLKKAISNADAIVIEGSTVSMSLGYILTESINLGKPVLFLSDSHLNHHKSRFLMSIDSKLLRVQTYKNINQLKLIVHDFLEDCPNIKTRFNLVLSNKLDSFIIKRSKLEGISKTEFIIRLIQKEMDKEI